MAKKIGRLRRLGLCAAGMLLLGASGCAFPHGSTQGDPLLGNFNRPIVASPMPERGGLGLDSPAYDSGSRIGLGTPDIPTSVENSSGFMTLPQLTSPNLMSGMRLPFRGDDRYTGNTMPTLGAKLVSAPAGPKLPAAPPSFGPLGQQVSVGRTHVPHSMITSGAAITPNTGSSDISPVKYEAMQEAARIKAPEEAQTFLTAMGAKWCRTEQTPTGEWVCVCQMANRQYTCRGREKLEAMKGVVDQIVQDQ